MAVERIRKYATGRQFADFEKSQQLRDSIYMNFVVIGEALVVLRRVDEGIAAQISHIDAIIGYRNQIVHGYAKLLQPTSWDIIHNDLPRLLSEVTALIGDN